MWNGSVETGRRLNILLTLLERQGQPLSVKHESFPECLSWLSEPSSVQGSEAERQELIQTICRTYGISEPELVVLAKTPMLAAPKREDAERLAALQLEEARLEAMLSKGGWLEWYTDYTRFNESPLIYHIFGSFCLLAAAIGRRAWVNDGDFKVMMPYTAILIGPTGRVRKSSVIETVQRLVIDEDLCPTLSDRMTPEALIKVLSPPGIDGKGGLGGHQFLGASEFSDFFGKQTYNEGLITLMLKLLEKSTYTYVTKNKGTTVVTDIALTILGASTLSLLHDATPEQVMSSGFLSRFVLVAENDTPRVFPTPRHGPESCLNNIRETLQDLKTQEEFNGQALYTPQAEAWYQAWYHHEYKPRLRGTESEAMSKVLSRWHVHLQRTATLLHLAEHRDMYICQSCFEVASNLLNYVELRMPQVINAIGKSVHGLRNAEEADYLLARLKEFPSGYASRRQLAYRCKNTLDSNALRRAMSTLIDAGKAVIRSANGVAYYVAVQGGSEHG